MNASDDRSRERRERWWRSAFIILATIYVGLLLIGLLVQVIGGFIQIVLVIFVAWLLAFVLAPVVTWLHERVGWPRGVAIGIVYAATLIGSGFALFYAASAIGASMGQMAQDFPETRSQIERTLEQWQSAVSLGRFQPNLVNLYSDLEATVVRFATSALGEVPEVTVAVFGSLVLVIILSLYMLADSSGLMAKFNRVVPTRYADEVEILERSVARAFGGFLRLQVILAVIQTALTVAIILIFGLPYGFLIAGASALAMLVPFFGPPLALVPPIAATAIFAPQWLLVVAPVLLVVQTVLVNYIQPRMMRDALGMHPILVLVGLLIGAQIAGLWGALFGIPVLAVLNVFFNYGINLRTIEETPVPTEEVLEEMRREAPEATPEELVALAADRVEESEDAEESAAVVTDDAREDLRAATGDLRGAAEDERGAAGELSETATDLRKLVEGTSGTSEEQPGEA